MSTDRYRTLSGEGTAVLREKASRFLSWAFPVTDEEAFKERLAVIAREHHASRHVCYAWVLGPEGERHRANDAGEPAGTAGRPVLNRIRSAGLTCCAVVVVRYFGGTLLGKAGLVQAYGGAAAMALENAPVIERAVCDRVSVSCTYQQLEGVRDRVLTDGGCIVQAVYDSGCRLLLDVPRSRTEELVREWTTQGITAMRMDHGK